MGTRLEDRADRFIDKFLSLPKPVVPDTRSQDEKMAAFADVHIAPLLKDLHTAFKHSKGES